MKLKFISLVLLIFFLLSSNAYSFGPDGHAWVGAIAQFRLAKIDPQTAEKVRALLKGIDLYDAANIPDRIKAWDRKAPTDPSSYHLSREYAEIETQLIAFWQANPQSGGETGPNHDAFHYTDISIFEKKYSDKYAGATPFDIVHMIPYCIAVLQGKINENNDRKITKPVALILLTHYIGDIHQPLHVGEDYFDAAGEVNPDDKQHKSAAGDQGGNTISLKLIGGQQYKMHSFWDGQTVQAALARVMTEVQSSPQALAQANTELQNDAHHKELKSTLAIPAQYFADTEPKGWKIKKGVGSWSRVLADQILPVSTEAHRRLKFSNIKISDKGTASADAEEIQVPGQSSYSDWSGQVIENEIHKGGWQLADLLEKILK